MDRVSKRNNRGEAKEQARLLARPNCSHKFEPSYDAANDIVRLYHAAQNEQSFSPLFKFVDEYPSVDGFIARAASERCLSWSLQNMGNICKSVDVMGEGFAKIFATSVQVR